MGKPTGMKAQEVKDAEAFIQKIDYVVIGTNNTETGVRLSALNNLPGQRIDELYFATDSNSQKVLNIRNNPKIEVMMTDGNGQIMLSGNGEVISDLQIKRIKWQPYMVEHFKGGIEDNEWCLVKLTTFAVRAMLM